MSQVPEYRLIEAINAFDYPPIMFDFVAERGRRFPSKRDLG